MTKIVRCLYMEFCLATGNWSIKHQPNMPQLDDIIIQGYATTENAPSSGNIFPLEM